MNVSWMETSRWWMNARTRWRLMKTTMAWLSWIKHELGTDVVDCVLFFSSFFKSISYIYFVMSFVTAYIVHLFEFPLLVNTLGITPCLQSAMCDSSSVQPVSPFVIPS